MDDYKVVLVAIAILLAIGNYATYLYSIFKGKFRPHLFTWGIWSLLGAIAFAAQWAEDAGPGMWLTFTITVGGVFISAVSFFKGDKDYKKSDWACLAFALLAIPLWMVTDDPVWSVILVTIIDIVAAWPTFRKSWHDPERESPQAFFLASIHPVLSIAAMSVINITTALYLAVIALLNFSTAVLILVRRRAISR